MKIFTRENELRKQVIALLLLTLLFVLIGHVMIYPELIGKCPKYHEFNNELYCISSVGALGEYIYILFLYAFFSVLPFLVLNPTIYRAWRWFAVVAMPLIIIIIATIPRNDYFGREAWTIFLSVLFFIITLLIIIYKSIRLKFTKKAEKR